MISKNEFDLLLKHAKNQVQLLTLQLRVSEDFQQVKTKLDAAKSMAFIEGKYLSPSEYHVLTQAQRDISIMQQRIQIKLAALREERRQENLKFENAFYKAARQILNVALLEDIERQARELMKS